MAPPSPGALLTRPFFESSAVATASLSPSRTPAILSRGKSAAVAASASAKANAVILPSLIEGDSFALKDSGNQGVCHPVLRTEGRPRSRHEMPSKVVPLEWTFRGSECRGWVEDQPSG